MKAFLQEFWGGWCDDLLRVAVIAVFVAIPVMILLFHVHQQYQVVHLGYSIAQVTREHHVLHEEHKKLRIEAAVQGRAARMNQLAKERFGLEPTRPEQVFIVEIEDAFDAPSLRLDEHAVLEQP